MKPAEQKPQELSVCHSRECPVFLFNYYCFAFISTIQIGYLKSFNNGISFLNFYYGSRVEHKIWIGSWYGISSEGTMCGDSII